LLNEAGREFSRMYCLGAVLHANADLSPHVDCLWPVPRLKHPQRTTWKRDPQGVWGICGNLRKHPMIDQALI
jgi:hypothetical protein